MIVETNTTIVIGLVKKFLDDFVAFEVKVLARYQIYSETEKQIQYKHVH